MCLYSCVQKCDTVIILSRIWWVNSQYVRKPGTKMTNNTLDGWANLVYQLANMFAFASVCRCVMQSGCLVLYIVENLVGDMINHMKMTNNALGRVFLDVPGKPCFVYGRFDWLVFPGINHKSETKKHGPKTTCPCQNNTPPTHTTDVGFH